MNRTAAMTGSDRTTINASMSGAPSLVNSFHSFHSFHSFSSSAKLNGSQTNVKSPEPEQSFVENFLEKAKFYTSLCLGKCNRKPNEININRISYLSRKYIHK